MGRITRGDSAFDLGDSDSLPPREYHRAEFRAPLFYPNSPYGIKNVRWSEFGNAHFTRIAHVARYPHSLIDQFRYEIADLAGCNGPSKFSGCRIYFFRNFHSPEGISQPDQNIVCTSQLYRCVRNSSFRSRITRRCVPERNI